jgi:AbrB family looped-hinge helix DNA binding protein
MKNMPHGQEIFYGSSTLGEKGQMVVPAEARTALNLKKGDKLLVFGLGGDIVAFSKVSNLQKIATHLAGKAESFKKIISKVK